MIGHLHSGIHTAARFSYVSDMEMSHPQEAVHSEATPGDWVAWQGAQGYPYNHDLLSLLITAEPSITLC